MFRPFDASGGNACGGACCHHPEPVEVHLNITGHPLLSITDLSLQRDDRLILSHVNLTVNQGDFIAITGPNGGGKTSMLRIILGLLKATSGKIEFIGQKPKIGYLPQKNAIDSRFPITVKEVIASGLLGTKENRREREKKIDDTLRRVELAELAARPIGRLSGGQLQRVLLGRAIISDPQLLVLDEPLSYIDKHFESHIYRIIAELAPKSTILLVSHEMSMIGSMANRHLLVDQKVIECAAFSHYTPNLCSPVTVID